MGNHPSSIRIASLALISSQNRRYNFCQCDNIVKQHHQSIVSDKREISGINRRSYTASSDSCSGGGGGGGCNNGGSRTYSTLADIYYQKHKAIPPPSNVHSVLPEPSSFTSSKEKDRPSILVIGDVHGCLQEMKDLIAKARDEENNGQEFDAVILVGDLVNKGPNSIGVLRAIRQEHNGRYIAVRGNHDDAALAVMLGDVERRKKKGKYDWIIDGENALDDNGEHLSITDEDVMFIAELPYTISIPWMMDDGIEILVVHAGLLPNVKLSDQTIETMVTIRDVCPVIKRQKKSKRNDMDCASADIIKEAEVSGGNQKVYVNAMNCANLKNDEKCEKKPTAWAKVWKGPQRVIFGHNAKRGFQQYEGDHAIGLDTGVCYGKRLTGIILPQMKVISVPAKKTC